MAGWYGQPRSTEGLLQSVVSRVCACVVSVCLSHAVVSDSVSAADGVVPAGFRLLSLDSQSTKWGNPVAGTGAVIRYSFVTEAMDRPGARNCGAMEPFEAPLANSMLNSADFRREIRRAFDSWERVADIRFVPAAESGPSDLVIGLQRRPRGIAYADVQPDRFNHGPIATIRQAAICFNPSRAWESGFDGNPATPDVRYVAAHEIGHVIGLDHSWHRSEARLMDFKNAETIRGPQPGDAAGAVYLYGAPLVRDVRVSTAHLPD